MYIIGADTASQCTSSCTVCVAGVIVCADSSDAYIGFLHPALEAIELVDVFRLESISQEEGETVSLQGRLSNHAGFGLNDRDASSFVRGIILRGYRLPFAVSP